MRKRPVDTSFDQRIDGLISLAERKDFVFPDIAFFFRTPVVAGMLLTLAEVRGAKCGDSIDRRRNEGMQAIEVRTRARWHKNESDSCGITISSSSALDEDD